MKSVAFDPSSQKILTGDLDGMLYIWDTKTGIQLKKFKGHSRSVLSVAFSPNGKTIASGSGYWEIKKDGDPIWDGTVKLWDVATGKSIKTFKENSWIISLNFSPDATLLAILKGYILGECCGVIKASRYDIQLVDLKKEAIVKILPRKNAVGGYYANNVNFTFDGALLVAGSGETVRVWDVYTGKIVQTLKIGHNWGIITALDAGGKYILSANVDSLNLWNIQTGHQLFTTKNSDDFDFVPTDRFYSTAYSPRDDIIVTTDWTGITFWRIPFKGLILGNKD